MKNGAVAGGTPVNVSVKTRTRVTAGLSRPVDEEENTIAATQPPTNAGIQ